MIKIFNSLEEIKKYYDKETNTYVFKENGEYIDLVVFNFYLDINANIDAMDIKAKNINVLDIDSTDINALHINANDINAWNINATDINANDISYFAVCFAYNNIKCKSIKSKSRRINAKHFVLDGKLEVLESDIK